MRKRSLHRRVADGRRKLAADLADLAPEARSPLQELPRREAITRALAATGTTCPPRPSGCASRACTPARPTCTGTGRCSRPANRYPASRPSRGHRCARPTPPTPHPNTSPRWAARWSGPARPGSTTAPGSVGCPPAEKSWTPSASRRAQRCERCARSKPRPHVVNAAADESTLATAPTPGTDRAGVEHDTVATGRAGRGCCPSPRPRCAPARRPAYARRTRRSARSPIPALGTPYGSRVDPRRRPRRRLPTPTWAEQRPLTPTRQPGPTPGTATHTRPATASRSRNDHAPRRERRAHPAGTPPQRRHRQEHRRSRRCRSFIARGHVDRPRPGRGRRAGRAPSRSGAAPGGRARPRRAIGALARRRPTRRRCPLRC